MNILFFGSSSFASQHLVKEFPKNCNLYFFSRRKNKLKNHFQFNLNKDQNILQKIKKIKKKINYIFLFSSHVPLNEKKSNWDICYKTNVLGYINLLKKGDFNPKKIIHASSCSIYGNQKKNMNEDSITNPDTPYSLSKFLQENILRIYCLNKNIKFLSYRIGYVVGDKMNKKRLLVKFLNKFRCNKKIKIFNKNKNLNLIHTRDIAKIILSTYKSATGIYNLTREKKTTLSKFMKVLTKLKKYNNKDQMNNFSSKKLFASYPAIKETNFKEILNFFKNAN